MVNDPLWRSKKPKRIKVPCKGGCGRMFRTRRAMNRHAKRAHGEK